jgi:V8-like Glu-specific endopeptidase
MRIGLGRKPCGALAAVVAMLVVAGCSTPSSTDLQRAGQRGPVAYWNRSLLLGARPFGVGEKVPRPGQTPDAHTAVTALRVGALFEHDASGDHFCTASVVDSPGEDLLITAAHCINGGDGGGYRTDIVFIPDYRDGTAPYGIWTPRQLIVGPQWANSANQDYDIGFVVLEPLNGRKIQRVLGGDELGTDTGYDYVARVTGYPSSASAPITCRNFTSKKSDTQLQFDCGGFSGGTSGSPWVANFDQGSRTGTIVGVIGGYQEGGDTPSLSYSAYLGSGIHQLYEQAIGDEAADGQSG